MTFHAIDDFSLADAEMMALALKLAAQGKYSTTPNPHVGCVVVSEHNEIVGQGFHKKAGEAHAEVIALSQAKDKAKGSTVYVTLEPCAHFGRTPPCATALINARVKKVIIACTDPYEKVSGKGIAMLEAAGIEVKLGLMRDSALALNESFFFAIAHKRPFITVKLAASLDGKTALASGESKWITSPQARADVQCHRAGACAILTGADTVRHDNPALTVRANELPHDINEQFSWRQRLPLRVVIDSQNRLDAAHYQIFQDGYSTLVYNKQHNSLLDGLESSLYQQKQIQTLSKNGRDYIDLQALMLDLTSMGVNNVWVEAGEKLTGALFDIGLVDRLVLYQAPKILGASARGLTQASSKSRLCDATTGRIVAVSVVGSDTKTVIDFSISE